MLENGLIYNRIAFVETLLPGYFKKLQLKCSYLSYFTIKDVYCFILHICVSRNKRKRATSLSSASITSLPERLIVIRFLIYPGQWKWGFIEAGKMIPRYYLRYVLCGNVHGT